MGGAHIVDTAGFQIAADAAGLDVHNGARAQLDGGRRRPSRGDRLVEAHRRLDELRQLGVPEHVVLVEGLLDQQQVEGVELRQVSGVVERVGGVGVDLKQQLAAVALAHGPYGLDVPAGLDLELDAAVALVEVALDGVEQDRDRVHDADADARVDQVGDRA